MKYFMRSLTSVSLILALGIFSCQDPNAPTSEFTVTVTGTVVNKSSAAQDSIVVTLDNPFRRDTTKTDGSFSYTFTSSEKNEVTANFKFTHLNLAFRETTLVRTYSSTKKTISFGEVTVTGVTAAQDSVPPSKASARAGIVAFVGSSLQTISIRGAGGTDATNLTFEVRDSLGVPVDDKNKATVSFKIVTKPDALVELNRATAVTSSNGQVVVQLSSGDRAGIAQVQAMTTVKNILDTTKTDTIKSPIVSVTIAGGLPVPSRFTIGSNKVNVPGLVKFNLRNLVTAVVGDTFGNPVQQGTLVYFSTTGGIIQPFSKTTEDGTVSVDLITGNPIPSNGLAVITAQVGTSGGASIDAGAATGTIVDEGVVIKGLRKKTKTVGNTPAASKRFAKTNATFSKTINVLFTGAPIISSNDSTFVVPPLGTKQIQFTVADANGNPMSQGTSIKVTGVGLDTTGAVLTGDINPPALPDTYDRSYTKFNISIADKRTKNFSANLPISLTVEVTGDNGNVKKTFTGTLASIVSGDSGNVGSISLVNSSVDSLVASGAGSPNSVTIQARVLTVNGLPSANIPVSFGIVKSVNGGEYLSAPIVPTNASGIATTTLFSGIRSGLVQVQASIRKDTVSLAANLKSVYIKTGKLSVLSLVSISSTSLSIKGGGGTENAVIIFEAKDSLGNTIDGSNQASVTVSMQGDTGGASISPKTMMTDPNTGRITASLAAGVESGIIQVTAQSGSIKSSAAQISVSGGLPVQNQFSISLPKKNFSILADKTTVVSVTAGDAFGNPAKSGTLISFKTNGGLIDATATTNGSGFASAGLQIVSPQPPNGVAVIEAKTFGPGGVTVRDTQAVIFSREAVISEVGGPFANFELEDGLSRTFQFTVADVNGNPLAQGNAVSVQVTGIGSENIVLSGDVNLLTTDSKVQGIGTTQFSFTARDTVKDEGQGPKPLAFKISVNGPNTVGVKSHSFSGTLKGGAGAGNEGSVASVSYVRSSKDTIFVANAGSPTSDTITFRVRNLTQQPVKNAAVQFNFVQSQNASEFLSPSYAVSDDSGEVKVVVNSGIKAGTLKVEAKVTAGNSSVTSTPVNVYVKTGPISSIALVSVSNSEISVQGVGGTENSTVVYEARDLLGNPLDYANQTKLHFNLLGVTGFDEQVKPDSAMTDPFSGRASVTIASGTRSTVLQAVARNASGSIKSSPVPIVVHGGFAVESLFVFTNFKRNISINDGVQEIKMQLGDRYGNPPKPGTAVYFQTNGGIIKASAFTDESGVVKSTFTPVASTSYLGMKRIIASTVGNTGDGLISDTVTVLISGKPNLTVTNVPTDTITLFDGASTTINYEIKDDLGNPISGGHQYTVSLETGVSSQLSVVGNTFAELPDTQDKTAGTKFSFVLSDNLQNSGTSGTFKIKIAVTGVTGTTIKMLYGKLLAPSNIVVPPSARVPASIALISSSATDLSISGVGGTENATLTYEVRDSVGAPINLDNRTIVTFSTNFFPNTFTPGGTAPSILPTIDSTDENGRVRVSIISGTQAGAVQLVATVSLTNPVRVIKSQPVRISVNSGFADQKHFTIAPAVYNFPGLQKSFQTTTITVQVGDKYSNPVKEGTVVYFNSANGIIQTQQGLTNSSGFVTMTLYSGNPYPIAPNLASGLTNGFSRVYARTIGRDSSFITDSLDILWSGAPIITKTDAFNTFTIADGGSAGPFSFTAMDSFGHPLSAGTVIAVEAPGLTVNGTTSITMPDTKSSGSGITSFSFTVSDPSITDTSPAVSTSITIVVTHPVYGTYKRVIASGTVD